MYSSGFHLQLAAVARQPTMKRTGRDGKPYLEGPTLSVTLVAVVECDVGLLVAPPSVDAEGISVGQK
jgi:hypothetical protein